MSDQEARALGAGDFIEVNGKEFHISPIGMQQLHEIQRAAVAYYKREYLRTYAENLDLLPINGQSATLMERKLEEVAHWDIGKLPAKLAYDIRAVPISAGLVNRLVEEYGELPENEASRRALLATLLDSEKLTSDDIQTLTGTRPRRAKVPYDTWWVTAVFDGMITFVWWSVKVAHPEATKEQVGRWPLSKIVEAARMVEKVTAPSLKNM